MANHNQRRTKIKQCQRKIKKQRQTKIKERQTKIREEPYLKMQDEGRSIQTWRIMGEK